MREQNKSGPDEALTRPRSSSPAVMMIDRPIIEWGPMSLTMRSSKCTLHAPVSSASMLPGKWNQPKSCRRVWGGSTEKVGWGEVGWGGMGRGGGRGYWRSNMSNRKESYWGGVGGITRK